MCCTSKCSGLLAPQRYYLTKDPGIHNTQNKMVYFVGQNNHLPWMYRCERSTSLERFSHKLILNLRIKILEMQIRFCLWSNVVVRANFKLAAASTHYTQIRLTSKIIQYLHYLECYSIRFWNLVLFQSETNPKSINYKMYSSCESQKKRAQAGRQKVK